MRKVVDYTFDYIDNGKEKTINFKIKRIPQSVLLDYTEMSKVVADVQVKSQRLTSIMDVIGELIIAKDDESKQKAKELIAEKKEIEDSLKGMDSEKFFYERFMLIKKLLEKNGITDEYFLRREFWEDDIDITELMVFLETVIYKDLDDSKKKE